MADQGLKFDRKAHLYELDGKSVSSVTNVCAPLYDFSGINPEVVEFAKERGGAVHTATEYFDLGVLDEASLDPAIVGYVEAWKKFCLDVKPEWKLLETPLGSRRHMFAGMLDRYGLIYGEPTLVDIKCTSEISAAVGVQLAGYKLLLEEAGYAVLRRVAIQLRADGTYRRRDFTKDIDIRCFLSLLTVRNWRQTA